MNTVLVTLMALALGVFVGRALVQFFFKADAKIKEDRRLIFALSTKVAAMGMPWVAEFLMEIASNDWVKLVERVHALSKMALYDETSFLALFKGLYRNMLAKELATFEGQAVIEAMLNDARKK